MTHAELRQLEDFDRVFDHGSIGCDGSSIYRAFGDKNDNWQMRILMNRDGEVESKSWDYFLKDDTQANRILAQLLNWLDWREGRYYGTERLGSTFAF